MVTSLLTTISSNSRGVLIRHPDRLKVAGLSAAAEILVSGPAAGTYEVKKNAASIYTNVLVGSDGVLLIPASGGHIGGDYLILQTGASAPLDITTASPLTQGTVGLPYSVNLSATGGIHPLRRRRRTFWSEFATRRLFSNAQLPLH